VIDLDKRLLKKDRKMKKPLWLKSTYIRAALSHQATRWLIKKKPGTYNGAHGERVLISSTDGLGDAFLRLSVINALAHKHGIDNVFVLTRDASAPLYEKLGVRTLQYGDKHRVSLLQRLKLVRKLNNLGARTIYVMDFALTENVIDRLQIPEKIGFSNQRRPSLDKRFTTTVAHPFYVGEALSNFCVTTKINPSLMDNTLFFPAPNDPLSTPKTRLKLAVAVGASNPLKMMRVSNFSEILTCLRQAFPQAEIILLGSGPKEKTYASRVSSQTDNLTLTNAVSNLDLPALISCVQDCDALIGFDSALYNLAFTLKKPTVCMAWTNASVQHTAPWVRIIRGSGPEWGVPDRYGCPETNAISPDTIIEALSDLLDSYRSPVIDAQQTTTR
jgi:ADP-heptose:LPS heptosyltransferase